MTVAELVARLYAAPDAEVGVLAAREIERLAKAERQARVRVRQLEHALGAILAHARAVRKRPTREK